MFSLILNDFCDKLSRYVALYMLLQLSSCDDVINNCDDVINNCDDVMINLKMMF